MNNAINIDLKSMFGHLYHVFYFLILHKFNSIYLVSRLFKWKKTIIQKDLRLVLILGGPIAMACSLPACFLKDPWKQCSSPLDMSSIRSGTCYIFSRFNVIISNPAIFLAIFNFPLITNHNIMAADLESHTIAIKYCFGMRQAHMRYFL